MRFSLKFIFTFGVFLMFITSMYPWFVWHNNITYYSCIITTFLGVLYYISNRDDFNPLSIRTILILLVSILTMLWEFRSFSLVGQLINCLLIIVIFLLLHLKRRVQDEILTFITKWLAIGLVISLIAYIVIYLCNINIITPKYIEYIDGRYPSYNYYLFILPAELSIDYFRFKSIFMEPGHMTMGLVPLIFANRFNLKNKYVLIIFISELFSFSLAAYIVMFLGYLILNLSVKNVSKLIYGIIFIYLATFIMNISGNSELLDTLIWDRLEYSNGNIAGNNRVIDSFETVYRTTISHGRYFFIGNPNVDVNAFVAAGYKRYIVSNGLLGCILVLLLYLLNFICGTKNQQSFAFCMIFLLLLFQNAYPFWYCLIISYLLGYSNYKFKHTAI